MGRRTRLAVPVSTPDRAVVVSTKPHPVAWAAALALAGGDQRRLRTLPDGSVLVS